ncbi:hypothetical protein BH09BAC1_BH09BAC1_06230 [soil metagenome]
MRLIFYFLLLIPHFLIAQKLSLSCNGHPELCDKRYDQVVYPTTHNAFNAQRSKQRWTYPNQKYDLPRQLQDGVKAFMIDVHYYNGLKKKLKAQKPVMVFHSYAVLGYRPLEEILDMFTAYLDNNPNEVLTFICQCSVTPEDFAKIVESHAIFKYVHSQPKGAPWPTLREMITSGKRFVFLNDRTGNQPWYHYQDDYCFENPYSNKSIKGYNCDLKPIADTTKSLYVFNHFLTGTFARRSKNRKANSYEVLMPRVKQCTEACGKRINFLTVDWYHWGDLFKVVDELNGIEQPKKL